MNKSLPAQMLRPRALILRWASGCAMALALVVWVGGYFLDSYPSAVWSEAVSRRVPPEGGVIQWRREGWATTRFWKYGISGVDERCMSAKARVLIWGDSYVEALQVNDGDKAAQQATHLWSEQGRSDLVALGVGVSGASAADYYFGFDLYEKLLAPVPVHVVLVSQLEDFYPDENSHELARFVSEPDMHFVPFARPPTSSYEQTINWYHRYRLQAYKQLKDAVVGGNGKQPFWRRAQWRMGPRKPSLKAGGETRISLATPEQIDAAFDFVFTKFREKTSRPILFVYCPAIPRIAQGEILRVDEERDLALRFKSACERHGFGFFDMGPTFLESYDRTGRFPRGFASTRPGRAHFNPLGHRLVAEAIVRETAPFVAP